MAVYHEPYRFNIYNVTFDITFFSATAKLDYGKDKWSDVTFAVIRIPKSHPLKTTVTKTVCNPHDKPDYIKGQQLAFKRAILFIWASYANVSEVSCKAFLHRASQVAFNAGMWFDEE